MQNFGLSVKKSDLNQVNSMMDFTLKYLKPAPPKMSVKPSQVRKALFPTYKSIAPPQFKPQKTSDNNSFVHTTNQKSMQEQQLINQKNVANSTSVAFGLITFVFIG
jgi:hypothetical protein